MLIFQQKYYMKHAMNAYYQDLTHGLGLIIISKAYYQVFIDKHVDRFITMAKALGSKNAKYTNGGMFLSDPVSLIDEEYANIYIKSFKE